MQLQRLSVLFVSVLLATAWVAHADDDAEDPDVLVLTDADFDDVVNAADLMLVEFYAPWCGHCKHLKPEYAKAATELKEHNPPIPLGKVDATKETKVSQRFGVSGYPTIKVFRNGKESPYNGPRTASGIAAYMKKQVGPAAKALDTIADVEKFINSDQATEFAVVGFFDSAKSSQLQSSFQIVAGKLRDFFIFGKVTDPAVMAHYGAAADTIIAFKGFDDRKTVYSGDTKSKSVEDWVQKNALPFIGEWSDEKADLYNRRDMPIAKFFLNVNPKSNQKQFDYYVNRLKKGTEQYRDKILLTYLNINDAKNDQIVSNYGLKGKDWGLVVEKGYADKFKFEDKTWSAETSKAFFDKYFAGELDKFVKSEDVPAKNDGPVKVVTGKTFEKIVRSGKHVLLEFYAPWCGHCKQLAPKYEELGRKFEDNEEIVIAKIDATANDYPSGDFQVKGYPTIYYVSPKAGSKPTLYEGGREVDEMSKWLAKKAKVALPEKAEKKKSKKSKKSKKDEDDEE